MATLAILRILSYSVREAVFLFDEYLDPDIGVANVSVTSVWDSIPDPTVLSVTVDDDSIKVVYSPLFPAIKYKFIFQSTESQTFQGVNGELLVENGERNAYFIVSPGIGEDEVRDRIYENLASTYDVENKTLIADTIAAFSREVGKENSLIKNVAAGNYLSVLVEDELVTRGEGPFDYLDNGGVFEVLRVGSTPTTSGKAGVLRFNSARKANFLFRPGTLINPAVEALVNDPISLRSVDVVAEEVGDDITEANYFSGLKIKVAKKNVVQLVSVTLKRGSTYYSYDIEEYGYALQNNLYDTGLGSINVNLTDQEFELSVNGLIDAGGTFPLPASGDTLLVSYIYAKAGRDIGPDSVNMYRVNSAIREPVPALLNVFYLESAPISTAGGATVSSGGVSFLNTNAVGSSAPFTTTHAAFTTEIPYDEVKVPNKPGEYSVNYTTGKVLVFGETSLNDGSGSTPPVATYYYRRVYTEDLDYTLDTDNDRLAPKSTRDINGYETFIEFTYEDAFAEGTDYRFLSHIEVLNERVINRLTDTWKIATEYAPIQDVFRIYNETTGEVYVPTRFNETEITFLGRTPPAQKDTTRERVSFSSVQQERLLVTDTLTTTGGLTVYKIALVNSKLTDSQKRFIGAFFNTSVVFSDTDIFVAERFYEDQLFTSVQTNIDRLTEVGEYQIDYQNGIVYVAVSSGQSVDLGDVSYEYADIVTKNDHILAVNDIYRSLVSTEDNIATYTIGTVTDTTAGIVGLESVGERFIGEDPTRPILVGTYDSGEDGITQDGYDIFTSYGASFTEDDIGRTLVVGSTTDTPIEEVTITGIISEKQVTVDYDFSSSGAGRLWYVKDLSGGANKTITLAHNIKSVYDIYRVDDLATLSFSELDGYWDLATDSFENNIITLGDDNPLNVGDAVMVAYNYGDVFIDYTYLYDNLLVSYEYGDNSLDWSISTTLDEGDEYYVTYKFGALRDALLANFGALTQIPVLTTFPIDTALTREVYRSVVGGALQSFIEGPTVPAIKRVVEAFTEVEPNITESFEMNWVVGADYLYPEEIKSALTATYDQGKYGNGISVGTGQSLELPAVSHLRLAEGTLEAWVRPNWDGFSNDANLTFDLTMDGYQNVSDIHIGYAAVNPTSIPFTLNKDDLSVLGQPNNLSDGTGYFIWFDTALSRWYIRWQADREDFTAVGDDGHTFTGTITTDGTIYGVVEPIGPDGYEVNETTDLITSKTTSITFDATIDCRENPSGIGSIDGGLFTDTDFVCDVDGGSFTATLFIGSVDGGFFTDTDFTPDGPDLAYDGLSFQSGLAHYIFDMADREDANRMALFKDGAGYLNFRVFDNEAVRRDGVGMYNIATDITDWSAGEAHHVAASWTLNSDDDRDELHLFVDGQEVDNLFKYGGYPLATSDFDFGDVAEETVIDSATTPIIGGYDGQTTAGSQLFTSPGSDFTDVSIGDTLYILEENLDGTLGYIGLGQGVYTITGVGTNSVTVDTSPAAGFNYTLTNIDFSINRSTTTVGTAVNFQRFGVWKTSDGYEYTELRGLGADSPDYTVERGIYGGHILNINNNVEIGDKVVVRPRGLIFRRCKSKVYTYSDSLNLIRVNGPAPISLDDVDITKIILPTELIADGYVYNSDFELSGGALTKAYGGDGYISYFDDGYVCQPSNEVTGRTLKLILRGDNFDFTGTNSVRLIGETAPDGTGTVYFDVTYNLTETGEAATNELWKRIDSVIFTFTPIDITDTLGTIEIREVYPINQQEAGGAFVDIASYDNGVFTLEIYGSGGDPFIVGSCLYEIDYPSFLDIDLDTVPDKIKIGSDYVGQNAFDGVIDEFRILDIMLLDTRVGETLADGEKSITQDYQKNTEHSADSNTLTLAHFNDTFVRSEDVYDRYNEGFQVGPSVNTNFGNALRVAGQAKPYEVSNAQGAFNNNEGTIEFWVAPNTDTLYNPVKNYYIDMSSARTEEVVSLARLRVVLPSRANSIQSVRLLSDLNGQGTDYFRGGSLSQSDGKTITLGTPLPKDSVTVRVVYTAAGTNGDRVSVFRDENGFVNFYMRASGVDYLLNSYVDWKRDTWHRVMIMWKTNSPDGLDRMRLFVDGSEKGTIKYGTGLLYGPATIYGQQATGTGKFIVDNIDLTDTFARVLIGGNFESTYPADALIDNVRFSEIQRTNTIVTVGSQTQDLNYTENTTNALPVLEDLYTKKILDFDKEQVKVDNMAVLLNPESGIFKFEVEVIDSFNKISNSDRLKSLLEELINALKPAHSTAVIKYI